MLHVGLYYNANWLARHATRILQIFKEGQTIAIFSEMVKYIKRLGLDFSFLLRLQK